MLQVIAFDCFGTVFDMAGVNHEEIAAYVAHVRKNDFTPFEFPQSWWELQPHPDSAEGIKRLQYAGYQCVALSNGDAGLIWRASRKAGIEWNYVTDLRAERVYKPNIDAYRTIEKLLGWKPAETLMVTANPTFGDIEGAAAIGMHSQVIRRPGTPATIIELAEAIISC
jgi:2-haloalkanoic acid dehalogenase type II